MIVSLNINLPIPFSHLYDLQKFLWLRESLKQSVRFYRTSEVEFLARKTHDICDLSVKVPGSNLCLADKELDFYIPRSNQYITQADTGGDLSLSFGAVLHCLNTHWVTITCVYDPLSVALLWLNVK